MAFFDKLNDLAKNIGDKTSDAIETTKLNSKISSERSAITEDFRKIGELCYARHTAGEADDPAYAEFFTSIDAHTAAIAELEAQIAALREQPAAEVPAATPIAPAGGAVCPACGHSNAPGTKFCSECGGKLEAPAAPQPRVCPNCGATVAAEIKFCSECGTKLE